MQTGENVTEFLEKLETDDEKEFDKISGRLEQLASIGPSRKKDEFNPLGDDLYEAKTHDGSRVVFFYRPGSVVICNCGFHKDSKKTRKHVLKVAKERKRAYELAIQAQEKIRIILIEGQAKPQRNPT
jgi:putative component of toxin-antitoxin plasmid stabilization module